MFGSISVRTRPIRIAYLVDPNNSKHLREAIQLSSTLWGGLYFPIIPIYTEMPESWNERPLKKPSAKEVILGYIEAFDPDIFVQFSGKMPSFISKLGIKVIQPFEIWEYLENDFNQITPKYGLGIFEILDDVFEKSFKFKLKYPKKVVFPIIPKKNSLFWASCFGEIHPKVATYIKKYYDEILEIEYPDSSPENLKFLNDQNLILPSNISQKNLYLNKGGSIRSIVFYLDALKMGDIIDFWNLRALGATIIPVPKQLKQNKFVQKFVVDFLKENRKPWPNKPMNMDYSHIIRSRNCTVKEVDEFGNSLKIEPIKNDISSSPYFIVQNWYPRIWNEWARGRNHETPCGIYGKESLEIKLKNSDNYQLSFKSLLPEFASKKYVYGVPRCINELDYTFYYPNDFIAEVIPKFTGKNFNKVINDYVAFYYEWRIGKNGLSKFVSTETDTVRNIPLAENLFFGWLEDQNWKVKLSPAGILAKQIFKKLDGDIRFLKNENVLGMFEYMSGGKVKRNHKPISIEEDKDDEVEEKEIYGRYMPIGEIRNRLKESDDRLLDYLLSKGIFKIGLRIKCPNCLRHSWFSLEIVQDNIICPLCLNNFLAIGNLDKTKPDWFYKIIGPFSVSKYADGAYAVLLSLSFLKFQHSSLIKTTPILSFEATLPNKQKIEADFAAFWETPYHREDTKGLLIGECKTYGPFSEDDFSKMSNLAKVFPEAILVFSTLRKTLSKYECEQITKITKEGRKKWIKENPINPVLILTGNELLSDFGPPSCWEDIHKDKMNYMNSILELCNATEQIYLKMQSWHIEFNSYIEKKYAQRRIKKDKDISI